jgi:hypothetical protein
MIAGHLALLSRQGARGNLGLVAAIIKIIVCLFVIVAVIQQMRSQAGDERIRESGDRCVSFTLDDSIFSGKPSVRHHWKPRTWRDEKGNEHEYCPDSDVPPEAKSEMRGQLLP